MNNFLQTRNEIDICTKYLQDNGLIESGLSCKNYDLALVLPLLKDGDICDLGSDGSYILQNAVKMKLKGRKVGIDLAYPINIEMDGIELFKGDLMATPFEDNSFDTITCLSVVEHSVDFNKIAKECSRLLRSNGNVFVSFDYWEKKINTKGILLYNLEWNILSLEDVVQMIGAFNENGVSLTSEIDWTIQDAVINQFYCSPAAGIAYTFGLLEFIKE